MFIKELSDLQTSGIFNVFKNLYVTLFFPLSSHCTMLSMIDVFDPFKVRGQKTTRWCDNIRDNLDSTTLQNCFSCWSDCQICTFSNYFTLEIVCIIFCNRLSKVAWDEEIAFFESSIFRLNCFGVSRYTSILLHISFYVLSINSLGC